MLTVIFPLLGFHLKNPKIMVIRRAVCAGTVYIYGGRDATDRSQTEEHEARRCEGVYKKFLHGEFADVLNCVLAWST